ncbi:adenylate cyclase [Desulfosarcina variabilis str. Montpellier]|uniref:CYTH domain-containing protein n=1 Tax=Desulfosarcina variabilis TaxID=2300 RepID=UPI003AFAC3A0
MGIEIERKFLVKHLPDAIDSYPHTTIRQGYLIATDTGIELRVRQKAGRCFQTIKMGEGLSRTEIEIDLSQDQFDCLWPHTSGCRVSKIRYKVLVGEYTAELDRFDGDLAGLEMVEVEFSSVEASQQFAPPEWFGAEVTEDKRYKNKWLAKNGKPGE